MALKESRYEGVNWIHLTMFFYVVTPCRSDFIPEDGDTMFLRNVGIYLQVYTASQPWSHLALDKVQWRALVNNVMKFRFS
jgi:hypothetical protein